MPVLLALLLLTLPLPLVAGSNDGRPNILIAISDDQSYPHASAYGSKLVDTPAFDRVAREGILFTNAYVASPGCSPSRAALLTGRYPWEIEQAGTHASLFPAEYEVFPDVLEEAGYVVGHTGKGWSPGDWEASGRSRNPAGPTFEEARLDPPADGISSIDYAGNLERFLDVKPPEKPFYFWYGAHEPHRSFQRGVGLGRGVDPAEVEVPAFLPDVAEIRQDLLDYGFEIEWFDQHLAEMLTLLESRGELDNTIVIVTSDNGMAFPRAKANVYDYGIHVPLAIRWGALVPGAQNEDALVSLIDLAPTILEAAGVAPDRYEQMTGRSLIPLLEGRTDALHDAVYAGRERHSSSRYRHLAYPQRGLRSDRYLYIRNFRPERWPAGAPRKIVDGELGPMHGGYHDIDAAPSLDFLIENAGDPVVARYLYLSVAHRPVEELYDVKEDPACLRNLAYEPPYHGVLADLRQQLIGFLRQTGDPRVLGQGDVWETYERLRGPMRDFPGPVWADPE